ncbi:hypothetical protein Tco_0936567, partial [Tanacetum coccineum]
QDFVTIEDLKDFSNTMLYTVHEIFFRHHQGPGLDDHAKTFSSLLLDELDKRNLNPIKMKASALLVLRRLGSIFTSVYAVVQKLKKDFGEDVVCDDDQPQDNYEPKTANTLNPEWFTQPLRPPTLDSEWNKRQVILGQPEQPWFNEMVSATKDPLTFNDLMATPIYFSKYLLNRVKIDNLTQDILLGPAYNLVKGTCHPGHLTIAADYFFNNDLEYLKSSNLKRTYTTSIMKTKETRYEIVGIEDMVPTLWSPTKVNKFSKHNVYSTKKILGVKRISVKKLHGYGHLEEIVVKRADCQLYKFKEGDFVDLHLNDIEDMLLLAVQHKLFHLTDNDIVDFIVALCMFTRSLVIKKRVEDL